MPSILSRLPDWARRLLPKRFQSNEPRVAVVRLHGAIGSGFPLRDGLTIAACAPLLERAFAMPRIAAVAIVVNSPGGSPVQSHLIYKRIRALAEEKGLPVLMFVEDAAASGGYMLACAGDEIFADPSSIVGSIGVVSAGFGFERLIERFGIERRLHTAGSNKGMLDPFQPERPEDVGRLKAIQGRVHESFVDLVRSRRGSRLDGQDEEVLFSGSIWSGAEAVDLGLVDGLGDLRSVMRSRFGEKVKLHLIPPPRPSLLARLLGRGSAQRTALMDPAEVIAALEERSAWARLGL